MPTLFTKIFAGEIKGEIIYQDNLCAALVDIAPQAPKHVLIIPRREIETPAAAGEGGRELLGHLLLVADKVAKQLGVVESGYRLVINVGPDAGQAVPHLHVHLLGGRKLDWPPG